VLKESPVAAVVESVKPELLEKLGGGTYNVGQADKIKNAIAAWQSENLDINMSSAVKTVFKDNSESEDVLSIFEIRLVPKKSLENVYFMVVLPAGIKAEQILTEQAYVNMKIIEGSLALGFTFETLNREQVIKLAVPGKVEPTMFAAPALDALEIPGELVTCGNKICEKERGETPQNCPEDCKPIGRAILYIMIIVVIAAALLFLIWFVYAKWYEMMREKKLFKNRKDLYSLMAFAGAELYKGVSREELKARLAKAGWNDIQIDYALKKLGKIKPKKLPPAPSAAPRAPTTSAAQAAPTTQAQTQAQTQATQASQKI
jgi:hypothetical protein